MSRLCPRHARMLEDAVELRGLLRPTIDVETFDAMADAEARILEHASNFCGRATIHMLTAQACPICFVNRALAKNQAGTTVDGWVDNAADETLEESTRRQDEGARPPLVVS